MRYVKTGLRGRQRIRRGALVLGWGLALAALVSPPALLGQVCANGGPNLAPFNMQEFVAADVGTPMLRTTLAGPDSRCNDGTPAVMYIRPAGAHYSGPTLPPGVIENEKWLILFLGGGGCADEDTCWDRWCGLTGYDRAGKMSTAGAYDAIFGLQGIFKRNPVLNAYAGYNQVVLYYCSSDNWIGSGAHLPAVTSGGIAYDIEFNGEAIVRDAFATLLAGPVGADAGPAATFYGTTLPALTSAEEIVLAGDSAGAGGLRHHLDGLRSYLTTEIKNAVEIYGVLDAGFAPGLFQPGITFGTVPGAPLSYADFLQTNLTDRATFWGVDPSALDQSCQAPAWAAAHNAVGSHPEICYDTRYTQINHITTPVFVRQDINDTLLAERYANWGLFPSAADFMDGTAQQLGQMAFGPAGLEAPPVAPGVAGPKCNRHVSILSNAFFNDRVDPGGLSFHDLLSNWRAGLAPSKEIQVDFNVGPPYTPSICP